VPAVLYLVLMRLARAKHACMDRELVEHASEIIAEKCVACRVSCRVSCRA
jgi:hypothetical protein